MAERVGINVKEQDGIWTAQYGEIHVVGSSLTEVMQKYDIERKKRGLETIR